MFKKSYSGNFARLAAGALALQACTPNTPKANVPDASITEVKIAAEAVTTNKIKDENVTTSKIADSAVTTAKIANGVAITGSTSSWSGAVTMASTLGLTGAATFSSSLAVGTTSTFGDSMTLTKTSTATAAGNVDLTLKTLTASPTTASSTSFNATRNLLQGSPTFAVAAASTFIAANNLMSISPTVAQPNFTGWGASNVARMTTPFAVKQLVGSYNSAQNNDVDTLTTALGVDASVVNTTTGTITTAVALKGMLDNAGGTVTRYIGLRLQNPADPTDAAPTTLTQSRYGVVSDGATAVNFFAGRVGIGTANVAPDADLEVLGGICVSDAVGDNCAAAAGAINADGLITANAFDLAERYPSSKKLEPGMIVAVDPANPTYVKEALPGDEAVVGIVSTTPGLALGWENNEVFKDVGAVNLIALAGRVPLKVSAVGGDIKIGDRVMLSSKAGTGMKANDLIDRPVVGIALESFSAKKGSGSILVMVKNMETPKASAGAYVQSLLRPVLSQMKDLYAKWSTDHDKLASLEKKIEIENIALKMENKALKNRLDKIEQALAQAAPQKNIQPTGKRKLASVSGQK